MNVLLVCTRFTLNNDDSWLSDVLAMELAKTHRVYVFFIDWAGKYHADFRTVRCGVEVYVFSTRRFYFKGILGKLVKWLLSSYIASKACLKAYNNIDFDLIVDFSPAITTRSIVKRFVSKGANGYLILWDFFPIYHYQLGLVPKILCSFLKKLEERAYNLHHRIGVMSDANLKFLTDNFHLYNGVNPEVLNLWGPNEVILHDFESYQLRRLANNIADELVCVFGGQLIAGRGVDHLLTLAIHAKNHALDVKFFIFGDGPERENILKEIARCDLKDLVFYMGSVSREEYIDFLVGADLGLVFNAGHVTVPTFPSKCIDYLRAALPMLAYVEDATDFGKVLECEMNAGWSASPSGDSCMLELFSLAASLPRNELRMKGLNGQLWYKSNMAVNVVAKRLVNSFD
ncbi:glycosyltransferase [Stutzerimonas stutzeri]|uniref:Glycosyl transferase family 1 domain-containing protein n=1 Tax=Stutzerimonas stutzeri TaxID=316 RepID=A0AA42TDB9_STUST|nr:glycosyltransferase [Stutzerimonas stutzeri]MDH1234836.1 hypothetical protein [Stutzerimonas stutzeri]